MPEGLLTANAVRIVSIRVPTKKLWLAKVPAAKSSAVTFSNLFLWFPTSHGTRTFPSISKSSLRWVLRVPHHLYFDSLIVVHDLSHFVGRIMRRKMARWRGESGLREGERPTGKRRNEERLALFNVLIFDLIIQIQTLHLQKSTKRT